MTDTTSMTNHRLQTKTAQEIQREIEFIRRMSGRVERNRRRHTAILGYSLLAAVCAVPTAAALIVIFLF